MSATLAFCLTVLVGLAFAGAVAEAFQFASRQRVSFSLVAGAGAAGLLAAPLLLATGPIVLIRNSFRGYALQSRPLPFALVGTALALAWSGATGWALLSLASLLNG